MKPKLRVGSDALWHRQDDMEVRLVYSNALLGILQPMQGLLFEIVPCIGVPCIQVVPALENGIYKDWDIVEALWDATFR